MKRFLVFLIFISFVTLQSASAEMDWEKVILRTSDIDRVKLSNLLKNELYALQYDEHRTVGEFLRSHFDRENRLIGLLNEYRISSQNYLTDGGIEYVYQLPLTNKIMALLLPETRSVGLVVPMLCPTCGQEWPRGKPVPAGLELSPKQIESTEYTGIIIDCRGFQLIPCLFPEIYNELMEEVYSINFADLNHVVAAGLVLYSTRDLYNVPRVGYNPLRIRAIGLFGNRLSNIKISSFDARRIHGSKKNLQLLKECRVAIIFGQ